MSYFRVVNDACFSSKCEMFEGSPLKRAEDGYSLTLGKSGSFTVYNSLLAQIVMGILCKLISIPVNVDGKQTFLYANREEYNSWQQVHEQKIAQGIFTGYHSSYECRASNNYGPNVKSKYSKLFDHTADNAVDYSDRELPKDMIQIDF